MKPWLRTESLRHFLNREQAPDTQGPTKCLPVHFHHSVSFSHLCGLGRIFVAILQLSSRFLVSMCQDWFLSLFLCPHPLHPPTFPLHGQQLCKTGFIVHSDVFLSGWEWHTCRSFTFYPLLYFKACFFLSTDIGNPLWFSLSLKSLMVWHRTCIIGNITQPTLTAASERFGEQPLKRE